MGRQAKKTVGTLKRLKAFLSTPRSFLRGTYAEYSIVAVLLILLTLVLTNFTLLQGTHKLFIDGPGDGTAGFLWFNTVEQDDSPVLGHTDMANYPEGEDLYNPTQVTYTMVWGPLWVLSKLFGPVMGLNIVTFWGIFICGLVMYWFIKRLTANPWVAFFAAYASAFIPYHLVKSSSHLTYIFSVVFIIMLAAFIAYWKRPTFKRSLLLAGSIALAFYTDGYFILLGSVFFATMVVGGVIYDIATKRIKTTFFPHLRNAAVIVGALLVALSPIAITQLSQGSKVDSFLSGARGNIAFDIDYYAAKPIDFITPSPLNPFLKDDTDFQKVVAYQNQRSNTSENNTYIGFIVLGLTIIGGALLAHFILRRRQSQLRHVPFLKDYQLVFSIGVVVVPVLVWCMLSPSLMLLGHQTLTLSDILLHYDISLWRVMARFYLPLHVMFVVLASLSLAVLVNPRLWMKTAKKVALELRVASVAIVAILGVLMAAEYATVQSGVSYDFNNLPKVYTQVKNDSDIKVIAELPLMDRPLSMNYNFATAQLIHGKKLVNTPLTTNVPGLRTALGETTEAIDYAVNRGADTIITHNKPCADQAWGTLRYRDSNESKSMEAGYYGSPICVYKVKQEYRPDNTFIQLKYGTFSDAPLVDKTDNEEYQSIYGEDGWLNVIDANDNSVKGRGSISAYIRYTPGSVGSTTTEWMVYQDGVLLASGPVPAAINVASIDLSKPIHIRVRDTQKPIALPFALSLRDITVTRITEQ